jgi:hypothetical protein
MSMITRRQLFRRTRLGAGLAGLFGAFGGATASIRSTLSTQLTGVSERLHAIVTTYPIDDTHCHPLTTRDAITTPDSFLQRISLTAMGAPGYFPAGVLQKWQAADDATKHELDKQYGISRTLASITRHIGESVFVKYMVKEMAGFLGCRPSLPEVIEARNARGKDYSTYIRALFQDVKLENVMLDTGFREGLDIKGIQEFARAVEPTRCRGIARVETIQGELLRQDLPFEELQQTFVARVRDALDGMANFGLRSYGMKSYLLPRIGLIKPVYDPKVAAASWSEYQKLRSDPSGDRDDRAQRGKDLLQYLLTLALEECLARDMPMQFHAGDGEAPGIVLRRQHPYFLEEIVRFDKNGVMRMPKIIPIHAGYPLVGEATWLSHLYTNCYYEISVMNPFVHQGLADRLREVMEAVPVSKILFGSDTFHLPELYWLAGRWGKRFLSHALGVYVEQHVLTEAEALEAARRILYQNNREVYRLEAA